MSSAVGLPLTCIPFPGMPPGSLLGSPWSLQLAASLSRLSPWVCDSLVSSLASHLSMKILSSHWSGLLTFPRSPHVRVTTRQATRLQNASQTCPVRPFLVTTHPSTVHPPLDCSIASKLSLCFWLLFCFDFGCLPYTTLHPY